MVKSVRRLLTLGLIAGLIGIPTESAGQAARLRELKKKAEEIAKKLKKVGETTATSTAGAASGATGFATLSAKLDSTALAPTATPMFEIAVSDDGAHAAGVTPVGSRFAVMVDGQTGPNFDEIVGQGPKRRTAAAFSPNGRRVGYIGVREGATIAVVDGKEFGSFKQIVRDLRPTSTNRDVAFFFSADNSRVAFVVEPAGPSSMMGQKPIPKTYQMVSDGTPGKTYSDIDMSQVVFAANRLAYVATAVGSRTSHVVIDGKEGPGFDSVSDLQGNADGHIAYVGTRGKAWTVVIDGVEGQMHQQKSEDYAGAANMWLAPSGARAAYVAVGPSEAGGQPRYLYVDGKRVRTAAGISRLLFSPDGKRLAGVIYESRERAVGTYKVFVDDWLSVTYQDIPQTVVQTLFRQRNLNFSPDSRRFAFIGRNGVQNFAVVDQQELNGYSSVENFQFSADSQHYGFEARVQSGIEVAVVDGKEGPRWYGLEEQSLTLSPQGGRSAYHGNAKVSEYRYVIDGKEQSGNAGDFRPRQAKSPERWQTPSIRPFVFSADGRRLAHVGTLMNGKSEHVVVLDGVKQGGVAALFSLPTFSADGKRFAYAAWLDQKWLLVVDGKALPIDGDIYELPTALAFDNDGSIRMLVEKDKMLHRMVVRP